MREEIDAYAARFAVLADEVWKKGISQAAEHHHQLCLFNGWDFNVDEIKLIFINLFWGGQIKLPLTNDNNYLSWKLGRSIL